MQIAQVRVGRAYAFPIEPGPWCRHAVTARVMARGARGRVLALLPDGVPSSPLREAVPRGSLVWLDVTDLACPWPDWPARAAVARQSTLAAVSSAVAAIGGPGALVLQTAPHADTRSANPVARARAALNRWARPEPRDPYDIDGR